MKLQKISTAVQVGTGVLLAIILQLGTIRNLTHADNASLTLSDPEYRTVEESVSARDAYRKRFDQASNAALNAQLKCESSIAALSEFQTSFALKLAAEARFEAVLSTQRLAHQCDTCEYSPDFKSLIRPAKKSTP